jgi:hypothetical protein
MAENIRKQLNEGRIAVENKGRSDQVNLPGWMRNAAQVGLDNENELVEQLREDGVLLSVLHAGLRDNVIQVRAKARAETKNEDGSKTPWIDHASAESHQPNPLPDPEKSKSKKSESPQEYIERRKAEGASKKKIMEELGL